MVYVFFVLTHCILNRLSHTNILEESNFNFRYIRLWNLNIPREKWLNYLQTVTTLIRCRILRHLIWVCTVCQLPFYKSSDYSGLKLLSSRGGKPGQSWQICCEIPYETTKTWKVTVKTIATYQADYLLIFFNQFFFFFASSIGMIWTF